jgi:hypothetical protein
LPIRLRAVKPSLRQSPGRRQQTQLRRLLLAHADRDVRPCTGIRKQPRLDVHPAQDRGGHPAMGRVPEPGRRLDGVVDIQCEWLSSYCPRSLVSTIRDTQLT